MRNLYNAAKGPLAILDFTQAMTNNACTQQPGDVAEVGKSVGNCAAIIAHGK